MQANSNLKLNGSSTDNVFKVYEMLAQQNIVKPEEIKLLELWLEDLQKVLKDAQSISSNFARESTIAI